MRKLLLSTAIGFVSFHSIVSHATSVPRGVAADHHVKVVQYDPNNVVVLKGRYGYQTQITFAQ
jgi:type IV secretory pathway VirB9-like protein